MVSLGFDIGKNTIVVARTDASYALKELTTIENTPEAIRSFLQSLQARFSFTATCESTGQYHLALARACLALSVPLYLVNPIVTKHLIQTTVRMKKTGVSDALLIARLGLQHVGTLVTEALLQPARPLLRASHKCEQLFQSLTLQEA